MTFLTELRVLPMPGGGRRGIIVAGHTASPCALGKGGARMVKGEGDGRTPLGRFALRRLWYRGDALDRPRTGLPVRRTRPDDGWCDAPGHRLYNRPVRLPFAPSHERMWREDRLYDLVVEIGWNDRRIRPGRGSAIFMHVARPGLTPSEGCVALERDALRRLLARIGPRTTMRIG
jgi:L,D-peptidoglycan transpeptidase YkuD (ErfK/YbiS/YcfS/YnhG family)